MNESNLSFKNIFKRETKLATYIIICVTIVVLSSSYALFFQVNQNSKNQEVIAGDLVFTYENGETITGSGVCFEPMTYEESTVFVSECAYRFSARNTGSLKASYTIKLVPKEENEIEMLKSIITEIRNIRNNMNVHPSKKSKLIFVTEKYELLLNESRAFMERLGYANEITIQKDKDSIPANAMSIMQKDLELYIPFEDLVDIEAEIERLNKEKETAKSELSRAQGMLSNEKFVSKAPEKLINAEKEKVQKYTELIEKIETRLNELSK